MTTGQQAAGHVLSVIAQLPCVWRQRFAGPDLHQWPVIARILPVILSPGVFAGLARLRRYQFTDGLEGERSVCSWFYRGVKFLYLKNRSETLHFRRHMEGSGSSDAKMF